MPNLTHLADRRALRIVLSLAIVGVSLSWSGIRPNLARALDTSPPQFFAAIEASPATATDHILIWLAEPIDPASIPDPSDFTVTVDGVEQQMTDVDLGYQGLVGSPVLEGFSSQGTAFLVIRWTAPPPPEASEPPPQASEPVSIEPQASEPQPQASEPPPQASEPPPQASEPPPQASEPVSIEPQASEPQPQASEPQPQASEPQPQASEPQSIEPQVTQPPAPSIVVTYVPGAHPLRDAAGNAMSGFGPVDATFFSEENVAAFVDEGAGPDHLILLVLAPIQPGLPPASDFSVKIGTGGSVEPLSITRRNAFLGYGLLDLLLPTSVGTGEQVLVSYTPVGTPLTYASGNPVGPLEELPAWVSVAAEPTHATPVSVPPGADVTVNPADFTTGASLADITFDSVTAAGMTTLRTSETSDGATIPGAMALGDPPTYFELHTTATFTGAVQICISYGLIDFTAESNLRLIHEEAGVWVDVTTSLNTVTDVICGTVSSFSSFAVVQAVGAFPFTGFFSPVDNAPTVNVAKAGSVIPVRFSLGGNRGLDVLASGYPKARSVNCQTGAVLDTIEETVTSGSTSLSYHTGSGTYTYNWKTVKSWAGGCRELVLVFDDTSRRIATFKFK